MTKRRMTLRVPVRRGDALRRLANHHRDIGALQRLRGHEAAVRQAQEDPTANFYDRPGDAESFENHEQQSSADEKEEGDWLVGSNGSSTMLLSAVVWFRRICPSS
ncbi:hypothetical protein PtB15_11B382 [Puccinia triticina]|nr:hypothetical protein PtB15_11B382 [Puccinia triticina]